MQMCFGLADRDDNIIPCFIWYKSTPFDIYGGMVCRLVLFAAPLRLSCDGYRGGYD